MPTPLLQRWLSFQLDVRMILAQAAPVAERNPVARSVRPAPAHERADPAARRWHLRRAAPPADVRTFGGTVSAAMAGTRGAPFAAVVRAQEPLPIRRWRRAGEEAGFVEASRRFTRRLRRVSEAGIDRPPLALRRDPAPPIAPARPSADVPMARRWFEPQTERQVELAAAAATVNVEQLASQVLKQIDRRVIARRERMGQA
jgi:hypothetical protein